jgi:hypothetical protein
VALAVKGLVVGWLTGVLNMFMAIRFLYTSAQLAIEDTRSPYSADKASEGV